MESLFNRVADDLTALTRGNEVSALWFSGERSDFVRFNHGKVRQAGRVSQVYASLHLIDGRRHAELCLTLSGDAATDRAALAGALDDLRAIVAEQPEDPHLLYATEVTNTRDVREGRLLHPDEAVAAVTGAAKGSDLVGFYASGPVFKGFANSLGQRNWHSVESFNLEWSLYLRADKAIKRAYAGSEWSGDAFASSMAESRRQFEALSRAPRKLTPGKYRAFLTPAAVNELVGMLSWGGFSGRARKTKQSCLSKLDTGDASMAPSVTFTEDTARGVAPGFQGDGFIKPAAVTLVKGGKAGDALVSPRTAREFDVAHNGANGGEMPEALDMAAGDIPVGEALARLGTGIYVGNLWYLNFSDRAACRLTGMTRFGTFWVENGEVVAPMDVMRFDDTIFRVLGDRLEGLTQERELILNSQTYRERAVDCARLPGALVSELTLTL